MAGVADRLQVGVVIDAVERAVQTSPLCLVDDVIDLIGSRDAALMQTGLAQPAVANQDELALFVPRGAVAALMATASAIVGELADAAIRLVRLTVTTAVAHQSATALVLTWSGWGVRHNYF